MVRAKRSKMSKFKCKSRVSQGKVAARQWGNQRDYTDVLQLLSDSNGVCEGSSFMEDLDLKMCLVKFDFFSFRYPVLMDASKANIACSISYSVCSK